jgi:glycosyltransferase involved in cell wall biosynthesis
VTDESNRAAFPDSFLWPLKKSDRKAYRQMAVSVNNSKVSVVSLQHEFGIFGGEAGSYILDFVQELEKPLITTFHTVFQKPNEPYRAIQQEIADRSDRIIVMNRKAIEYLRGSYHIPAERIVFIPHGTPVPDSGMRSVFRQRLKWSGRKVILTFGLLSRGKGIEMILDVLPEVVKTVPEVLYAIVGQTHPEVKKREGESYRQELQSLIHDKHLEDHVVMIDRYLDEAELIQHLTACDLYVTPYPGMQQITSGTLAYAVGLGRPVLSTPYVYAMDLLQDAAELLVPFDDRRGWARQIAALLSDEEALRSWEKRMAWIGRNMGWPYVGLQHARLFAQIGQMARDLYSRLGRDPVVSISR